MKHVIAVTLEFTVAAPAGTDFSVLEHELADFARRAIDAAMTAPEGKRAVPLLDGRHVEVDEAPELVDMERLRAAALRLREKYFRFGRGWSDEMDIADLVAEFSGARS